MGGGLWASGSLKGAPALCGGAPMRVRGMARSGMSPLRLVHSSLPTWGCPWEGPGMAVWARVPGPRGGMSTGCVCPGLGPPTPLECLALPVQTGDVSSPAAFPAWVSSEPEHTLPRGEPGPWPCLLCCSLDFGAEGWERGRHWLALGAPGPGNHHHPSLQRSLPCGPHARRLRLGWALRCQPGKCASGDAPDKRGV